MKKKLKVGVIFFSNFKFESISYRKQKIIYHKTILKNIWNCNILLLKLGNLIQTII